MPRLDRLSELQRKSLLTHPCLLSDDAPWTPLARPLAQARLAIVTTAGLHRRGDRPFTGGEQTCRVLPADLPARDIVLSHTSIGFDRTGIQRDLNLVYPVDRLRELVAQGTLGSLGPTNFSFLGAQRAYEGLQQESGPAVARQLRDEGVDAVLLTGA